MLHRAGKAMRRSTQFRLIAGVSLFLLSEFVLAGSSEGYNKWTWIEVGTVPNVLLALGFCFL